MKKFFIVQFVLLLFFIAMINGKTMLVWGTVLGDATTQQSEKQSFQQEFPPVDVGEVASLFQVKRDGLFKTYVEQLCTPAGRNILRDAPSDHLHHHGLMFGIKLDDVNFWEEFNRQEYGRQVPINTPLATCVLIVSGQKNLTGYRQSEELNWTLPDDSVPVSEYRDIVGWRDDSLDVVLLDWSSRFEVVGERSEVKMGGNHYHGLGLRFDASMDRQGYFFADVAPLTDLVTTGKTEHVSGDSYLTPCRWMAYQAKLNEKSVTVAIFDAPENPRPMLAFTMGQTGKSFAYLSATINLWRDPYLLKKGESVRFHYAIAVWEGERTKEEVETAYSRWLQSKISDSSQTEHQPQAKLPSPTGDQPQWGEKFTRNMISKEQGLPNTFRLVDFDPATGYFDREKSINVRWARKLSPTVYGTPIIAQGKVFIGCNGAQTPEPYYQGDRGVLACLSEKTGELLWQLVLPKMTEVKYGDWFNVGITSAPVVEGDKLYLTTNRGEIACLDLEGQQNGNQGVVQQEAEIFAPGESHQLTSQDADILWMTDMLAELGVQPHNAANCSLLIDDDIIYACTGNGTDWTHTQVLAPEAPTLIALDKKTGKIIAVDSFHLRKNIIHGQWSSPTLAVVNGRKLVFQGTGSGFLFAVDAISKDQAAQALQSGIPLKLNTVWKFNGHPLAQTEETVPLEFVHDTHSYELTGNPVFYEGKLYAMFTQEMHHSIPNGFFTCLDPAREGDTTRNGGLIWAKVTASSDCTPAIHLGLVYLVDGKGTLYCLDAQTGTLYWEHPLGPDVWGSPLVADGKIFIGNNRRRLTILQEGKELTVLDRIALPGGIYSSVTAANKTLFIPFAGGIMAIEQQGTN